MASLLPRRWTALLDRSASSGWLYVLVPVPILTDWLENGALPHTPRGWITEVVGGVTIAALVNKVVRNHEMLQTLALSDPLTGLRNRRAFEAAVAAERARALRSGETLSVVYLDVDRFKAINDREGHAAGDRVLCRIGAAIGATIREHVDGGFRLGGDEFALLLPATSRDDAAQVVDRIRARCAEEEPSWRVARLDLSAGIVEFEPDESPQQLIQRSDAAMYREKIARRGPGPDRPGASDAFDASRDRPAGQRDAALDS